MARNSGVLIRQLLGNRHKPFAAGLVHHHRHRHHRRYLLSKSIQNLTSVPSPSQTIDIRSASKPFYYYSLQTPSLQFLQQRRCLSSPSDLDFVLSGPSNLFVIETLNLYYDALQKVEDDRLSAVFFYTAPGCRATCKWVTPIFGELCEQFQHITMYKVYMDQNGPGTTLDILVDHPRNGHGTTLDLAGVHMTNLVGSTLDELGIHRTPTFHCYLKGERVDELAGASVRHMKKRLENVYNLSGMKKRRRRGEKDENDGGRDLPQLVEVLPIMLPQSSIPKAMDEVQRLESAGIFNRKMYYFAKGMFSCQEKREMFCMLKDPDVKVDWFRGEMALD